MIADKIKSIIIYCILLVCSLHSKTTPEQCNCEKILRDINVNTKVNPIVNVNPFIYVPINTHNANDIKNNNWSSNNISNFIKVITPITTNIHAWFKQQLTYIKSIDPKKYQYSFQSFLSRHKYKIFFFSLLGSYGTLSIKIIFDNHYLNRSDLWGMWQPNLSFDQLCEIPQKKLGRELILEIQRRYLNQECPTDFINPLIMFIKAVDYELKHIIRYIRISTCIKHLHLLILFPTNEKKIEKAQLILQKLRFVKHIFLSWAAEYNLMQKQLKKRQVTPPTSLLQEK